MSHTHSEVTSHVEALDQKEKEHKAEVDAMTAGKAMLEVCIAIFNPSNDLALNCYNLPIYNLPSFLCQTTS